jgi:hypothetical protein
MNSGSIAGSLARMIEQSKGSAETFEFIQGHLWLFQMLSFMYLLLAIAVYQRKTFPISFRFFAVLSIISVAQPGAAAYTWGWVGFAVAIWVREKDQKILLTFQDYLFLAITFLALVPIWLQGNHVLNVARNYPQYLVLSPLILLLLLTLYFRGTPKPVDVKRRKT